MDLGIRGKKALVLASSQGLGLGVATKLCEEGANVLLNGRTEDRPAAAASRLAAAGSGSAAYTVTDLSDTNAAEKMYAAARDKLGGVDILINNTGGPPPATVDTPDSASWRAQIDTMLIRIIEITNLCVEDMKEAGWGRILTIASSGIIQPIANLSMSNTIRSALVGWNKSLSNEIAGNGITVNIIAPGRIHTERVIRLDVAAAERVGKIVEEIEAVSRATIPARRYGTVEEFGSVGAFLVSEPASYMTGSVVRCDGGSIRSV